VPSGCVVDDGDEPLDVVCVKVGGGVAKVDD
jgi:hypothetical protein